MAKTPLRSRINRFFFKNQNKGIRNLMLYIAIGNVVVFLLSYISTDYFYKLLRFDYLLILKGQVWRLFTYPLCYLCESMPILGIFSLLFYFWCGRILDEYWGPLRFNLYYLSGILLVDAAAMAIGAAVGLYQAELASFFVTAIYLNLSLLLAAATVIPEEQIRIWFVIPVKMKWLAWLDVGLTLISLIRTAIPICLRASCQ